MTLKLLKQLGIKFEIEESETQVKVIVQSSHYKFPEEYYIEPDASTAGYDLLVSSLYGIPIEIKGLTKNSIQGES